LISSGVIPRKDRLVIVAGASGFLGRHFVECLIASGYRVIALARRQIAYDVDPCAISDNRLRLTRTIAETSAICKGEVIFGVLNAATAYGRASGSLGEVVDCNLVFSVALAEFAVLHRSQTYLNLDTFFTKPTNTNLNPSSYTLSKLQALEWVQRVFAATEVIAINFRLEHVYGPRDSIHKFIPWLIRELARNTSSISLSHGHQLRDFIYIDDVCTALLALLDTPNEVQSGFFEVEIGSGQLISVREMILTAHNLVVSRSRLCFGEHTQRQDIIECSVANLEFLNSIGWKPTESVESGLGKLISHAQVPRGPDAKQPQ